MEAGRDSRIEIAAGRGMDAVVRRDAWGGNLSAAPESGRISGRESHVFRDAMISAACESGTSHHDIVNDDWTCAKQVTGDAENSIAGQWPGPVPGSILDKDCLL